MKMIRPAIGNLQLDRPAPTSDNPLRLYLDGGYDYEKNVTVGRGLRLIAPIQARGEEASKITKDARFRSRRWVVERTHSWMN